MIINDLHVICIQAMPAEADPPLAVYTNAVLTFAVARQRFQTVAGRNSQRIESNGRRQVEQLSQRYAFDPSKPPGPMSAKKFFRIIASERANHSSASVFRFSV